MSLIDMSHYDGAVHRVDFEPGADFAQKWEAYRADGFTVATPASDYFLVCKLMPGEDIPT